MVADYAEAAIKVFICGMAVRSSRDDIIERTKVK
jgi:hypothetical protein